MMILLFVWLMIPGLSSAADAVFGMTSKGIVRVPHMGMVEKTFGAPRMHNIRSYWNSYKPYSPAREGTKDSLEKRQFNQHRLHENGKRSNSGYTTTD